MNLRRGACPSISAPMQTGDGLLVRLDRVDGRFVAGQLGHLARAAEKFGNGVLEITTRGRWQIRGVGAEGVAGLAAELAALNFETRSGVLVQTGPLSGLDSSEIADPNPLARDIRAQCAQTGLHRRLGPKVSVTVDGGGALGLGAILADVKLEAVSRHPRWLLRVGGNSATARPVGCFGASDAVKTAMRILNAIADRGVAARAYDLGDGDLAAFAGGDDFPVSVSQGQSHAPVGRFPLAGGAQARGLCLPCGQIESGALAGFAKMLGEEREIRLAPGRGMIVLNLSDEDDRAVLSHARELGFVTDPRDPRLSLVVCVGKPGCGSAHLATKVLANALVARLPDLLDGSYRIHLSGCEKRCACPSGASVTLTGRSGGYEISGDGMVVPQALRALLVELADEYCAGE